jgi:hypothetical protein
MKEKTTVNKDVKMAAAGPYPEKRAGFKACLLANPNYFGTIQKSDLVPVFPMKWNTHYEELVCVGYHPQKKTLEGVVHIYQPSGYGTDECGAGTPEYVRFFLSYDKGTTWEDMGVTGFRAYDIPEGTKKKSHLEYAVSLPVDPKHSHCFLFRHQDTLVRVRAILSWNDEPDAGDPHFSPVWGNVKEATIQIDPEQFLHLEELYAVEKIKDMKILKASAEAGKTIPIVKQHLGAMELAELYRKEDVPVHRFAFKEFASFADGRVATAASKYLKSLKGIKIPDNLIELLHPKTDGDTSYEELKCIGLDPNMPDRLVGIIKVKKACGYSGPVCTSKGSVEYVTFWADFDGNGSFGTCLGTADVTVHDVPSIKNDGIFYAVTLPVDLSKYRPECKKPRVVRIRAILSWNSPVPRNCPSCVPCWGNREETTINIAPESACPMPAAEIAVLGGIPVSMIDVDGLTTPDAKFAAVTTLVPDSLGRPCPFGGYITVHGAPVNGAEYLIEVSRDGGVTWTDVYNDIWVTHKDGTMHLQSAHPVTHRFRYLKFDDNILSLLAIWYSSGNEKCQVRLSVSGAPAPYLSDTHTIQLDHIAPEAYLTITSGTGDCGKFAVGATIQGQFTARDEHFAEFGLGLLPVTISGVPVPLNAVSPDDGYSQTPVYPGTTWTLSTAGMNPCGYNVHLIAWDRTIINSQNTRRHSDAYVGFCLARPSP